MTLSGGNVTTLSETFVTVPNEDRVDIEGSERIFPFRTEGLLFHGKECIIYIDVLREFIFIARFKIFTSNLTVALSCTLKSGMSHFTCS